MDIERFNSMVARLERESAADPRGYRVKVALLALLGFAILGLVLAALGFGLVALAGIAVGLTFMGSAAILLLLKLGKLLFLLAIPLWYTLKSAVRALFVRLPAPQGRELKRAEAPALFAALDRMRASMGGPRFHHVLVVDDLNAAVMQRPAFGLVGWPRNYLLLGLPLLECLGPDEALAVVAHEYGHLAGSHGRFSAFIYRLRHTWGTVQAYVDHFQGWLGRLVAPLVGWYAPYFNAYTWVLARADEYRADAASAELVGAHNAVHALKRVNLVRPLYQRFMQQTYERTRDEATPPADLPARWAAQARSGHADDDAQAGQLHRWLSDALDREGHVTDTHPTLRARLDALAGDAHGLPPAVDGPSAAEAWLGTGAAALRAEIGSGWASGIASAWQERHAEFQSQRARLGELRALPGRDTDQDIEMLRLALDLEPDTDWRDAFAVFNAAHPDHPVGLYFEGLARLAQQDDDGLALLDRAMDLDGEAIKPACERAHAYLAERGDKERAETYAERWRQRAALEAERDELEGRG